MTLSFHEHKVLKCTTIFHLDWHILTMRPSHGLGFVANHRKISVPDGFEWPRSGLSHDTVLYAHKPLNYLTKSAPDTMMYGLERRGEGREGRGCKVVTKCVFQLHKKAKFRGNSSFFRNSPKHFCPDNIFFARIISIFPFSRKNFRKK